MSDSFIQLSQNSEASMVYGASMQYLKPALFVVVFWLQKKLLSESIIFINPYLGMICSNRILLTTSAVAFIVGNASAQ